MRAERIASSARDDPIRGAKTGSEARTVAMGAPILRARAGL